MEIEDLAKKIDWLEKEHRKDRTTISDLQEKLVGYEGSFSLLQNQIKELSTELTRYRSTGARLDQFDNMVTQYRARRRPRYSVSARSNCMLVSSGT